MTDEKPLGDSERLEFYLDDLMNDVEKDEFIANSDPHMLEKNRQIQGEIENSLRRSFGVAPLNQTAMEQIANRFESALTSKKHDWSRQRVVRMALAASLIAITTFSIWYFISGSNNGPFFEPRSVVAIYQETVDRGFKPYYECHDMARFAEVFQKRQLRSLELKAMPDGTRMLGLSYLGGFSRDTTAMLGESDGKPVMVFVDQLTNDDPEFGKTSSANALNVFRETRN